MSITINAAKNGKSLFFTNENAAARRNAEKESAEKRNSLYAGDIGVREDSIQIKRQQAQKKAMKMIKETFESDRELDQSMEDMRTRSEELQEQNVGYHQELKRIEETRNELAEAGDSGDYENMMSELDEQEKEYRKRIAANESGITGIRQSLSDTKIDRLKSDPMQEAQGKAEDLMMAANKEIYGELMNEGKKHIEEKMAEETEKADKRAEKKEEEEEKKAEQKEQEAQQEEWIENTKEAADKKIDEILDEFKLIQDDLKGAAVDTNL